MSAQRLISTLAATLIVTISGLGIKIQQNASIQPMSAVAQTTACNATRQLNFSGKVGPYSVNLRADRSTTASVVRTVEPDTPLNFEAWGYGDVVLDIWRGTPDARWYKLKGENAWVSSAVEVGNAPHSTPICPNLISARLQAFLDTIAYAEGTNNPDGYRTIYGYQKFDSFADHPRRQVCLDICSDAAGRYQFLSTTWDGVRSTIKATDFSPLNQDLAAKELIREREALDDVENGNIQAAIEKCSYVWASLPPARYNQPTKSLQQLLDFYQKDIANYN